MLVKEIDPSVFEQRGGYRGGSKPGNYSWSKPGIRYKPEEQVARDRYLSRSAAKLESLRKVMRETGCPYGEDDHAASYAVRLFANPRVPQTEQFKRNYAPQYAVRYQEYLKGNNGLQAL